MADFYKKHTPEEVFLFYFKRELTDDEVAAGITLNKYGNVPTGIEFLDYFAGLVRRFGYASSETYAKAIDVPEAALKYTISTLTGRSINEWIDYYVLLGAYEVLKNKRKELKEYVREVGFTQYSVFSKYFKKRTKETPSDMYYLLRRGDRSVADISQSLGKYHQKETLRRQHNKRRLNRYKV